MLGLVRVRWPVMEVLCQVLLRLLGEGLVVTVEVIWVTLREVAGVRLTLTWGVTHLGVM